MGLLLSRALREPLLQIALDFIDIDAALNVAQRVVEAGADVIEVGTPLVKCCGLEALKRIKPVARDRVILADLKTVDAYEYEFKPYIASGANAVTMLGIVDDDVIEDAVKLVESLGADLVVDMIYVQNPVNRALKLAERGVKIVLLHIGIDVQKRRGVTAKELLKEVADIAESGVTVAVAGGIKPSEVGYFIEHGARIVIVGSAVTKSPDPYRATLEALTNLKKSSRSEQL